MASERLLALALHHRGEGEQVVVVRHVEPVEALARRDARGSARSAAIAFSLASVAFGQRPRRTSMCDGMCTRCPTPGHAARAAGRPPRRPVSGSATPRRRGCRGGWRRGGSGRGASTASSVARISSRAGLRLAVRRPQVPRAQVHQRLGEERRRRRRRRDGACQTPRIALGVGLRRAARGPRAAGRRSARRAPRSARARRGSRRPPSACACASASHAAFARVLGARRGC